VVATTLAIDGSAGDFLRAAPVAPSRAGFASSYRDGGEVLLDKGYSQAVQRVKANTA
jgi:hypothetical protein